MVKNGTHTHGQTYAIHLSIYTYTFTIEIHTTIKMKEKKNTTHTDAQQQCLHTYVSIGGWRWIACRHVCWTTRSPSIPHSGVWFALPLRLSLTNTLRAGPLFFILKIYCDKQVIRSQSTYVCSYVRRLFFFLLSASLSLFLSLFTCISQWVCSFNIRKSFAHSLSLTIVFVPNEIRCLHWKNDRIKAIFYLL